MHREEPQAPPHMTKFARHLRKETPVPERILWGLLRDRRLGGFKFRRQQPLGPYVADFFCEEAKLVVELDGESHRDRIGHDEARDRYFERRGLAVLRIGNDELLDNREAVAQEILNTTEDRLDAPRSRRS